MGELSDSMTEESQVDNQYRLLSYQYRFLTIFKSLKVIIDIVVGRDGYVEHLITTVIHVNVL